MIVAEIEVARLVARMIFKSVRDDPNLQICEHLEKLIWITDPGDCVHDRVAKLAQRLTTVAGQLVLLDPPPKSD